MPSGGWASAERAPRTNAAGAGTPRGTAVESRLRGVGISTRKPQRAALWKALARRSPMEPARPRRKCPPGRLLDHGHLARESAVVRRQTHDVEPGADAVAAAVPAVPF